ncbi:MAG TPA: 4Fe-4S dicluster domain-containing protein [Nitrospirae bacterium]|nr:4Fe-4S dicluster domain-containing protein [Nitrospirota bacterium]
MEKKKVVKVEEIKKAAEEKRCPVQKAAYYIEEFLKGPMCGRCFPCAFGSYEAGVRLRNIIEGSGKEEDIFALRRITEDMIVASLCKRGKDSAEFVHEWMETDAFKEHVEGRCPDIDCPAFIEYIIIPEKCTMCGLCKEVCKYNAVLGEKKVKYKTGYLPFEVRQKRCVKCGDCIDVCPTGAIIVTESRKKEGVKV